MECCPYYWDSHCTMKKGYSMTKRVTAMFAQKRSAVIRSVVTLQQDQYAHPKWPFITNIKKAVSSRIMCQKSLQCGVVGKMGSVWKSWNLQVCSQLGAAFVFTFKGSPPPPPEFLIWWSDLCHSHKTGELRCTHTFKTGYLALLLSWPSVYGGGVCPPTFQKTDTR